MSVDAHQLIRRRPVIGATLFTAPLGLGKCPNAATISLGKILAPGSTVGGAMGCGENIQPGTGKDFDGSYNGHTETRLLLKTLPN
jgi:hypothetical protein